MRPAPYIDLTNKVGPLEFTRIYVRLFRTQASLLELLREMNPGRSIRLPPIDFARQEVFLVAAGPRSSTGYELRIVGVRDEGDRIVVVVRERTPSLGDPVKARVTYPFRLIALQQSEKPVKLKWPGRP